MTSIRLCQTPPHDEIRERAKSKEQRAKSKEQRAKSKEQRAKSKGENKRRSSGDALIGVKDVDGALVTRNNEPARITMKSDAVDLCPL